MKHIPAIKPNCFGATNTAISLFQSSLRPTEEYFNQDSFLKHAASASRPIPPHGRTRHNIGGPGFIVKMQYGVPTPQQTQHPVNPGVHVAEIGAVATDVFLHHPAERVLVKFVRRYSHHPGPCRDHFIAKPGPINA